MPKVKDRSALTKIDLEKRYGLALRGLEDGTYDTLAKAAQAHDLQKYRNPVKDTTEMGDTAGR